MTAAPTETLGDAGFVFTLPTRCTPTSSELPTPREVAPWIASIERLWDDQAFEDRHRAIARETAQRWDETRGIERFLDFFDTVIERSKPVTTPGIVIR